MSVNVAVCIPLIKDIVNSIAEVGKAIPHSDFLAVPHSLIL